MCKFLVLLHACICSQVIPEHTFGDNMQLLHWTGWEMWNILELGTQTQNSLAEMLHFAITDALSGDWW